MRQLCSITLVIIVIITSHTVCMAELWVLDGYGQVYRLPRPLIVDLPGGVTMEMVLIPAGSFVMGSTEGTDWCWCHPDNGYTDTHCEQPVHQVNIEFDFYMCKTEVTQAQWLAVVASWPGTAPSSTFGVGDDYPAYNISWYDCQDFVAALNQLGQGTFRLPSEAEWEYACRAGTTTRFYFGDSDCAPTGNTPCELDAYAWWCGNNGSHGTADYGTKPVGGKLPNAFGLYDVHGNVWEWCQDYWHEGYAGAPVDGSAWESPTSSGRVDRGGPWGDNAQYCRSSSRSWLYPDHNASHLGFRVVRTP